MSHYFGDRLVAAFEPWLTDDLEGYLRAVASMFEPFELYATESEEGDEGWTILLDPDRCPAAALPYLAQYVGERLPLGLTEAQAREWVKDHPNQRRGTALSIFLAVQRSLTGSRLVAMRERTNAAAAFDVDWVSIYTVTGQTPDPARVRADILTVFPADLELNYQSVVGQNWDLMNDTRPTWTNVKADYLTWNEVATDLTGFSSSFSRGVPA